jgi:hypothetical protein
VIVSRFLSIHGGIGLNGAAAFIARKAS